MEFLNVFHINKISHLFLLHRLSMNYIHLIFYVCMCQVHKWHMSTLVRNYLLAWCILRILFHDPLGLLHLQHVFVCAMCTFIAMELPFAPSLHMYTGTKTHIPTILQVLEYGRLFQLRCLGQNYDANGELGNLKLDNIHSKISSFSLKCGCYVFTVLLFASTKKI